MATKIDVIIPFTPGKTPQAARRKALKAARAALSAGQYGAECYMSLDSVRYVVAADGVHRLTKSPDGRTVRDRLV